MAIVSEIQSLSSRGQTSADAALPVFVDVIRDPFSWDSNPTGYLSLGVAENVRIPSTPSLGHSMDIVSQPGRRQYVIVLDC